jgi:hypothetical protein
VIGEIAPYDLRQPFPLFGDRPMHTAVRHQHSWNILRSYYN